MKNKIIIGIFAFALMFGFQGCRPEKKELGPKSSQLDGIHGNWVLPFITPIALEIDTEDDFKLLEYQLQTNPDLYTKIFNNKD